MLGHISNCEIYVAALVLCVTNLLFTFLQRRTDKMQNKFHIINNSIVLLNSVSMLISELTRNYRLASETAFMWERIAEFSYFLFHLLLAPMFAFYVLYATGSQHRVSPLQQAMFAAPLVISELFLFTNPFLHFMYRFDESRNFIRCWGEYIVYGCCVLYFFYAIFKVIFTWKSLSGKRRFAMAYFFVLVASGIVLQMLNFDLRAELFAESLGLIGVMIAIETEDDRIDIDTGFYNRRTLQTDIDSLLYNRNRFSVLCIKVTNADIIQRATGSQNSDILSLILSPYLKSIVKRYYIYNATPESFILTMMEQSEEEIKPLAQQISERFEHPFSFNGSDIPLNAVIMTADVPARLHTSADVLAMADQPIPKQIVRKVLCGEELDYLLRRVAVEEAVTRGLEEHYFEVYYQPTYYVNGELHGAEALIRLHDPVIGSVFPDEFIPVAEQMGMIDQLDNFVYDEVCQFWKTGIPSKCGMDCINVNLSVMHCMLPGFVAQINEIAAKHNIDKHHINFEITESVAANDYNVLASIVNELKREGYHFSMDDYGTGYSNMEAIFTLDFDVVKIDKSILWSAEKSDIGRIVLENTVHMVRQMKRRILVEGVETKAQVDLLATLGVSYLQGYFFSKPVPKQQFIEIIRKGNLLVDKAEEEDDDPLAASAPVVVTRNSLPAELFETDGADDPLTTATSAYIAPDPEPEETPAAVPEPMEFEMELPEPEPEPQPELPEPEPQPEPAEVKEQPKKKKHKKKR